MRSETRAEKDQRMRWWRESTFGLFVHFGLFAIPAGYHKGRRVGRGTSEWIMHSARIPDREYAKYAEQFNPVGFNASEWVATAKAAGVRYLVITTKHHDGFCLWDSQYTSYDVIDATPFRRDIVKELKDALRGSGIALGLYYSIMDWHHPDAVLRKYNHLNTPPARANWSRYREEYMKPQLQELTAKFDPALFWFDGDWIEAWSEEQGVELYNFLRRLKPSLLVNNRLSKARKGHQGMNRYKHAAGDFGTPEQEILKEVEGYDWESCMTINDNWGFTKDDSNWKTTSELLRNLVDVASKGGNYLLNVGPAADGVIPAESVSRLRDIGRWLLVNGEAIYGVKRAQHAHGEGKMVRFTTPARERSVVYAVALQKLSPLRISNIRVDKSGGGEVRMLGHGDAHVLYESTDQGISIAWPPGTAEAGEHGWVFRIHGTFAKRRDANEDGLPSNAG